MGQAEYDRKTILFLVYGCTLPGAVGSERLYTKNLGAFFKKGLDRLNKLRLLVQYRHKKIPPPQWGGRMCTLSVRGG